jgi:hypothetical protein
LIQSPQLLRHLRHRRVVSFYTVVTPVQISHWRES